MPRHDQLTGKCDSRSEVQCLLQAHLGKKYVAVCACPDSPDKYTPPSEHRKRTHSKMSLHVC
eukprot:2661024-Pleurochrysis_carterae.AAC.8